MAYTSAKTQKLNEAYAKESRLKAELKEGRLSRIYFLYGEEDFLVKTYVDKITALAVPEGAREMNVIRFSGNPPAAELADAVESFPFFSEKKCVIIKDLSPDEMENDTHKAYLKILEDIPETTVLIIAEINVMSDFGKPKAKLKKIMEASDKAGFSCEMRYLPLSKAAAMAAKKAARAGCTLSGDNAAYLAELCGRSLTLLSNEIDKLCAYKNGGEITRADIDMFTPKPTDASIYALSDELFAGRTGNAFRILDELFLRQTEPIIILGTLSGYFTDLYRAKTAITAKKTAADVVSDFKYPPNRSFVVKKAFEQARRLSEEYIGGCIGILYNTNILLNSSRTDKRALIERALAEISLLKK